MERISIRTAVVIGTLWVNIPVLPLMLTPMALFVSHLGREADQHPTPSDLLLLLAFLLLLLGFVVAWSWWSLMVPRWRVWAWSRVEDLAGLKRQAVRAGLIWPDGHAFEKTELRSKATQAKLNELESQNHRTSSENISPAKPTAPRETRSSSARVFPFRHVENRFLSLTIAAGFLAIIAIRYALVTIGGVYLAAICCSLAAVVTFVVWYGMRRHYREVMPHIVQGPKRILALSSTIGFCVASVLSTLALVANHYIHIGAVRYVDAQVLHAGRVVGPKLWGWDAKFGLEGNSYYQMISQSDAAIARSTTVVQLGLQKGFLGYEFIVSINARR